VNCGLSCASFSCPKDYLQKMTHPGYQAPYCILTDVEMPGLSGYELIKEVRKRLPYQRFIVTTSAPEKKECCNSACLYFHKPVAKEKLRAAFQNISKCVEYGGHPECTKEKPCLLDDRSDFPIETWTCPFRSH